MGTRAYTLGFFLSAVFGLGCGRAPDGVPSPTSNAEVHPVVAGDPPSVEEAARLPAAQVARWIERLEVEVGAYEGDARAVELGRRAAALARELHAKEGGEWLDRARVLLEGASRRRRLSGACAASVELVRLEKAAGRKEVAYEVAYRTLKRFAGRSEEKRCVDEAATLLSGLESHRPSAGRLALIDLDPDGDDPSAGIERGASLERIVLYGHASEARNAPVRIALHFRGEPAARVIEEGEEGERRWVLEIPGGEVAAQVSAFTPVGSGGLDAIRLARTGTGDLRVVLELSSGARTTHFALPDPFRFIVDVHTPEAPAPERIASREGFTVVIDPGHGGDDHGARQNGLKESQIVLDLARRAARLIEQREPRARVFLTRHGDDFLSLEQRTAMANAADADLFVSVHLNSADDPVARGGVTTFVLSTSEDRQALLLAARENGTTVDDVSGLQRLLADLHRRDQVQGSRALAERIQRRLLARGRQVLPTLGDRGVKDALFYVLVGARMPAVLVEASFLTYPTEAEMLKTDRYRQALGDGIAEGVLRYLETLPARRAPARAAQR